MDHTKKRNWDALAFFKDKRLPTQHVAFLNFYYNNILPTKEIEKRHVLVSICRKGDLEKLLFVLRNISFDVYPTNNALFVACRFDHVEIVKVLLHVFRSEFYGHPMDEAAVIAGEKTCSFLLKYIDKKYKINYIEAMNLLKWAAKKGSVALAIWVLERYKFICESFLQDVFLEVRNREHVEIILLL